ncbi:MAG: proton-conducting transporter membrane subunit, partial [Candidatus Acidiferrales bacterium]
LLQRNPVAAVLMLIFLLSLAGIPPTAGFVAKFLIFWALVETKHYILAVLAAACLVPAAYFCFRMVAAMWVRESGEESRGVITWAQKVALGAMAGVTLLAGIFPEQFLRFASYSILNPFQR